MLTYFIDYFPNICVCVLGVIKDKCLTNQLLCCLIFHLPTFGTISCVSLPQKALSLLLRCVFLTTIIRTLHVIIGVPPPHDTCPLLLSIRPFSWNPVSFQINIQTSARHLEAANAIHKWLIEPSCLGIWLAPVTAVKTIQLALHPTGKWKWMWKWKTKVKAKVKESEINSLWQHDMETPCTLLVFCGINRWPADSPHRSNIEASELRHALTLMWRHGNAQLAPRSVAL